MSVLVAVGEHNVSYASALMTFIGDEPDLAHAGTVDRVEQLVDLIAQSGAVAAVVDARLPAGGIEAVAEHLQRLGRTCRLIMVSPVLSPSARRTAARTGAVLVEQGDGRRLLEALTAAEH